MSKETPSLEQNVDMPLSAEIRVRVRHTKGEAPCPFVSLVNAVRKSLGGIEEIEISPGNGESDGWRGVIAVTKALVLEKDIEKADGYNTVLRTYAIDRDSENNRSVMFLSVKDPVLNVIMEKSHSYQMLTNYVATTDYEDFRINVVPANSVSRIIEDLAAFGEVKLIEKDIRPLRELAEISGQTSISSCLSEEEAKILKAAGGMGWFEFPRPEQASLANIAEHLNISAPTLSIRLRNINRKLSEEYFRQYVGPR